MRFVSLIACLWLSVGTNGTCGEPRFVDISIRSGYRDAILANEFLMDGAVDVVNTKTDGEVLVGVGVVAMSQGSESTPAEILTARTVARGKAEQAVARFLKTEVTTATAMSREVTVETDHQVGDGEVQRHRRVNKWLVTRNTETATMSRRMKDVGSWWSADRKMFYYAIGVFVDP